MNKNLLIAILGISVIVLVGNLFQNWFTLDRNERVAKETVKANPVPPPLDKKTNPIDSTTIGTFAEKKGEIINNYVTNEYMVYVQDTLTPAYKIKTEQIQELTRAKMVLEGQLKATKIELDENKKARVYYENKYIQIVSNESDTTVDYRYNAIVDIVNYNERKWWLGKEKSFIGISSPDKNLKINGVEHFKKQIEIKNKPWGLGAQLGYYYAPAANQFYPAFGIGISYNFLRF
ncbi:hypothetical protein [Elizabethkingia ursingii]|uniref:Uncharacterized protein n=1 Tax=Elizabethkingia ursingii TaxID=1756150 RepID=A0AAJ3TN48_9FLAO|nr:hypothetical protein [Elizabethkingia ursingii]AQX08018.1 hypothetical protein BBD34_04880 [Elizabethkingia ursingii]OPB73628.1 hypothetical protein BAY32_11340 [Elizabethkingia ursingii]